MRPIILAIILTALRDRLFLGLGFAILIACGIAAFIGSTAVIEQQPMALSYSAGSIRMIMVLGMILFICFHLRRMFEHKEIDVLFSRPLSRTRTVLGLAAGFAIPALLLPLFSTLLIALLYTPPLPALVSWAISILLELWLVTAFALTVSLILPNAVLSVLATLAFYCFSRLMGFLLYILDKPGAFTGDLLKTLSNGTVSITGLLIPRLDLFSKTEWLVYSPPSIDHLLFLLAQSAIYITLLLTMGMLDVNRKEF